MKKLRILIADDHDLIRRGIRAPLESRMDWEICGKAHTGRKAVVEQAAKLQPDVLVLDISMPDLNGNTHIAGRAKRDSRRLVCCIFEEKTTTPLISLGGKNAPTNLRSS
jgi:DNA-binding NarL/FixJ family response regulator